IAAWAASRPDIVGLALIGSWARRAATPSSDIDLIILAAEPQAFRDQVWPNEISWAAPMHLSGWRDADYGALWSRHIQLSGGPEIEISFADRSWARTSPCDRATSNIVRGGCRILIDKENLFERLEAATRAEG